MVVTPGAGNGQAQKRFGHDIDLVIDAARFVSAHVDRRVCRFAEPPEAGGNAGFIPSGSGFQARTFQQITSDLFNHEIVVGEIFIERPDQVVAVDMGVTDRVVRFVAVGLGETCQIEPVSGPSFAEAWRREQAVNHFQVGLFRGICDKIGDLFSRRGAAQSDPK